MILIDSKVSYVCVDVWPAIDVFCEFKSDFLILFFFVLNSNVRFNERSAVSFAINERCIMYDFR